MVRLEVFFFLSPDKVTPEGSSIRKISGFTMSNVSVFLLYAPVHFFTPLSPGLTKIEQEKITLVTSGNSHKH